MKQHEISVKTLNVDALHWLEKLRQVLLIQDKGKGTVKNYTAEMMLLFKYYNSKTVDTNQLKATKESKVYKEMIDVQFVLRFFTVKEYWENFSGNMDQAMDKFMVANYKNSAAKIEEQKQEFLKALTFCGKIWSEDGFMRPDASKRVLQGFYDIQMVCSTLLSPKEYEKAIVKKDSVRKKLHDLLENDETFMESVTQFTSNQKSVKYRIETFANILKAI